MTSLSPRVRGSLVLEDVRIPLEVDAISSTSLLVRLPQAAASLQERLLAPGGPSLNIQLNGQELAVGPCRLESVTWGAGGIGKLTLEDRSLDIEQLLIDSLAEKARAVFLNLPTLLAYKEGIDPAFKDYISNLIYDLSIYRKLFDDFDQELQTCSDHIKSLGLRAVLKTEGDRFYSFLDDKLDELARLVDGFDKTQHRRHGFYFRRQMWDFILASDLIARGNLKPRGYSGDSEMMNLIYANDYRGESTFAKLLFKHSAAHPASQAVRNRRALIADGLAAYRSLPGRSPRRVIKVLSVASGSATEMWDIFRTPEDCRTIQITLLDQDGLALAEAERTVEEIQEVLGEPLRVKYLNCSVRTMLTSPEFKNGVREYDFIYSMGLFDYLTPRVGRALMSRLCGLLVDGGELLAGNFHISNPTRHYMEYWVDWVLYYRTEDEFRALIDENAVKEVDVYFEETGSQMFLRVRR